MFHDNVMKVLLSHIPMFKLRLSLGNSIKSATGWYIQATEKFGSD